MCSQLTQERRGKPNQETRKIVLSLTSENKSVRSTSFNDNSTTFLLTNANLPRCTFVSREQHTGVRYVTVLIMAG